MKKLALVVPCYNEEEVLPYFYAETSKMLTGISDSYVAELVFVDDGSKDGTLRYLKDLAERDLSVKYISFSRNFGKEAAMLAGMEYAVNADFIGILDADLQHSPDIIPQMLRAVTEEGYDVAAARRSDREGESKFKSFLSGTFYKVINRISETKISESAQDFRVMKQAVVKSILSMPENNRFSKGIFSWVGFNVKWIEHKNRERAAGDTKWSIRKLAKYAVDGILGYTTSPLRISFFVSALFAVCAVFGLLYALIRNIVNPAYTTLMPLLFAGMFFIGASILFCIGILGEYLARVYTEVKDRPKFIIAQSNTMTKHSWEDVPADILTGIIPSDDGKE